MLNPTVRQAIHKLDFIIVGGSITGLATGFGLARSGHRVHIFEQMPEIVRECAGVRIPPNATALLKKWGLEEDIRRVSSAVLSSTCMDLNSGEPVGLVPWGEDLVQELGSRWYALNYRDLVEILYRAALRCGVRVATSARVTSVNPPPQGGTEPRPSITLEDGRTFHAHVVLGADGVYSSVRASIEEEPPQAESHGIAVYSGLVPIEAIDSDPRIPDIRNSTPIWCGTNQSVVVNAASPGFCSFTLFWDDAKNEPDTWDLAIPSSSLSIHSAPVPDCVKRLVSATDRVARQKYDIWPSFEDLVDQTGTIAVLGDAARPTALLGNNTTSNPIESAAVIATLFSYIRGLDQIPVILNAYEDILRAREDTFTKAEHLQRQITLSPPGPQRDAIRATLASGWEGISLEDQWNQISQLWAYDAIDAANDWWINWGVLRERALFANAPGAEAPGRFDELHVSVTAH